MTGPNHMWQKHVSGSCVGHGRFGGHLIRYSSFLIQSFKSTVPFGSAPRRINSLTANHRVLHDCINRWDKQNKPGDFNQRIFESLLWAENFWEEMFTLLESGSEPLKSWKSLIDLKSKLYLSLPSSIQPKSTDLNMIAALACDICFFITNHLPLRILDTICTVSSLIKFERSCSQKLTFKSNHRI